MALEARWKHRPTLSARRCSRDRPWHRPCTTQRLKGGAGWIVRLNIAERAWRVRLCWSRQLSAALALRQCAPEWSTAIRSSTSTRCPATPGSRPSTTTGIRRTGSTAVGTTSHRRDGSYFSASLRTSTALASACIRSQAFACIRSQASACIRSQASAFNPTDVWSCNRNDAFPIGHNHRSVADRAVTTVAGINSNRHGVSDEI